MVSEHALNRRIDPAFQSVRRAGKKAQVGKVRVEELEELPIVGEALEALIAVADSLVHPPGGGGIRIIFWGSRPVYRPLVNPLSPPFVPGVQRLEKQAGRSPVSDPGEHAGNRRQLSARLGARLEGEVRPTVSPHMFQTPLGETVGPSLLYRGWNASHPIRNQEPQLPVEAGDPLKECRVVSTILPLTPPPGEHMSGYPVAGYEETVIATHMRSIRHHHRVRPVIRLDGWLEVPTPGGVEAKCAGRNILALSGRAKKPGKKLS